MAGPDAPTPPDPAKLAQDPDALREAHKKYGDYLKKAGLPFEDEEFEDAPEAGDSRDADAEE